MQRVRGLNPLSSTRHNASAGFPLDADHDLNDAIDAVYRDKYRRYSPATLDRNRWATGLDFSLSR
jgi:hypothetical protein